VTHADNLRYNSTAKHVHFAGQTGLKPVL